MRESDRLVGMTDAMTRRNLRVHSTGAPAAHTSAVIVLIPSDPQALLTQEEGSEPAHELHCTLWFLGKVLDTPVSRGQALIALSGVAETFGAVHATVKAVGTLGNDTPPATVALLTQEPEEIRVAVKRRLGNIPPSRFHSFTPHVTTGYGTTLPMDMMGSSVVFTKLGLWWGMERYEFPLA